MRSEEAADPAHAEHFEAMVRRRLAFEPVQYIIGSTSFMGLTFEVAPQVLIPRPESETVIEHALTLLAGLDKPRILDIGTGSGCLAVALARFRPDATVEAWDVSEQALSLAEKNATQNGVSVLFLRVDVLSSDVELTSTYDLVISNPPYVPLDERESMQREVVDFEPHLALFAGDDPLIFYREIARLGRAIVRGGGYLVFETHADFGSKVLQIVEDAGYKEGILAHDLSARPRIVSARHP